MSGLDLFLSQRTFVRMLFIALATGLALGVFYDALCILRLMLRDLSLPGQPKPPSPRRSLPRKAFRFLLDFVFAVTTAVAFLILCYYTNDGQLRAPAIIGMACGFFVYRRLISPPVLRLAAWILHILAVALGFFWRHTIGRCLSAVGTRHRRRVTDRHMQCLARKAAHGFAVLDGKNQIDE